MRYSERDLDGSDVNIDDKPLASYSDRDVSFIPKLICNNNMYCILSTTHCLLVNIYIVP